MFVREREFVMGFPPVIMSEAVRWAAEKFVKWSRLVVHYRAGGMHERAKQAKSIADDWLEWCRDMNRGDVAPNALKVLLS